MPKMIRTPILGKRHYMLLYVMFIDVMYVFVVIRQSRKARRWPLALYSTPAAGSLELDGFPVPAWTMVLG